MSIFMGLLPIIVIFGILVVLRKPADVAGLFGWILMGSVAHFYFETPITVILLASLAGIVSSLPITLAVSASMLQMCYMQQVGAINRLVVLFKSLSNENKIVQILLINIGFGTLITALGAVPIAILPPIMLALGYSSFVSIALPSIGYDALCTYAMLGVPVIIFSNFTGIDIDEAGGYFSRYMPVISSLIAFAMLWIAGKWSYIRAGWLPTLLTGLTAGFIAILMNMAKLTLLTGVAAGIGVILVLIVYLTAKGQPLFSRTQLSPKDLDTEQEMGLVKAFSPWILLIAISSIINISAPIKDYLFNQLSLPLHIIPGGKPIHTRVFFHAYWWMLVTTIVAVPIFGARRSDIKQSLKIWVKRAPRPTFSSAIFFSIAYIMNYSGTDANFVPHAELNIISALAKGSSHLFGETYGLIAPYLGLLGGFISGTETSAIAMLTKFHLETAEAMWDLKVGLLVAAASGIGGGLASVISPSKLQTAAAMIDKIGEESHVIRTTMVLAIMLTFACAIMTFFWSYF